MAVNGKKLDPVTLLDTLNKLGGEHGIGRVDLVENRFVGMKSRGVYETPGVTILQAAHRALESITMDREVMHLRDSLGVKFAENVYYGFWFAPEFKLMRKFVDETQDERDGRREAETVPRQRDGSWTSFTSFTLRREDRDV